MFSPARLPKNTSLLLTKTSVIRTRTIYFRLFQYAILSLLIGSIFLMRPWFIPIVLKAELQTALDFSTTVIAFIVGMIALIKYITRHKNNYLFIGFAFIGSSVLTGIYALLNSGLFVQSAPLSLSVIDEFQWSAPQFVIALFSFTSILIWFIERVIAPHEVYSKNELLWINITLIALSFFYVFAIPAYYRNLFSLALFLITAAGYLYKQYWFTKYFEHWFIMFLILNAGSTAFYLASGGTNNTVFFFGHLFQMIAYGCGLVGLLISIHIAFDEVEEGKDTLNAILLSIGDGVFVTDVYERIVLMNKQAEYLSGVHINESIGLQYTDIFRFIDEKNPTRPYPTFVSEALQTKKIRETVNHTFLVAQDGSLLPIVATAASIQDKASQVIGCVVVIKNMTRERELENIRNNFLSVAAHQLRSPLGAIKWNIEMLIHGDMGKLTKPVKEVLLQANEISKRLVNLANDLLMVSRIDQLRVFDKPAVVNIPESITTLVKELKAESFVKGVTVSIDPITSSIPSIMIDPNHLREVLSNIVSNAIKYNKRGGEVRISVTKRHSDIIIKISDTGMGIPDNDKERIFSKFYRSSNAISQVTDGSGLGLFVVKSFVTAWGGDVTFTSKENKGTTFTLVLPMQPRTRMLGRNLAQALQV